MGLIASNGRRRGVRRGAAALLAVLTAFAAAGCGNDGGNGNGGAAPKEKPVNAEGKTVVTFAVLTKDRYLARAEAEFEQAHPDIDVVFEEQVVTPDTGGMMMRRVMEPGENPDLEKFVATVNTEVLSGEGADLIQVDQLPYGKYADKGLLADLSALAEADPEFDAGAYNAAVLDAVKHDGKWYALPIRYQPGVVLADGAAFEEAGAAIGGWDWEAFVAAAEKVGADKDGDGRADRVVLGMPPEALMRKIVESDYAAFVDEAGKTARFDDPAFTGLLERVEALYDSGAFIREPMSGEETAMLRSHGMVMDLLLAPTMTFGESTVTAAPPSSSGAAGWTFDSDLMAAINANSPVKEEAWAFLKFLLTEELQADPGLMGFPVNRAGAEKALANALEGLSSGRMRIAGPKGEAKLPTVTPEQQAEALKTLDDVNRYVGRDRNVLEAAAEAAASYFEGSVTAEEAGKRADRKVETYLNE